MKGSQVLKALEDGKRIGNSVWPEGHYWEMQNGKIQSTGGGKNSCPEYTVNDLFEFGEWEIVPKYISFGDAMKSIEEGKDVVCFLKDEKITVTSWEGKVGSILYGTHGVSGGGASLKIAYMVAGKWMLKEDTE